MSYNRQLSITLWSHITHGSYNNKTLSHYLITRLAQPCKQMLKTIRLSIQIQPLAFCITFHAIKIICHINYIHMYGNNSNQLLFLTLCIINNCNHSKYTRDRYSHTNNTQSCKINIASCTG